MIVLAAGLVPPAGIYQLILPGWPMGLYQLTVKVVMTARAVQKAQ